MSLTNDNGFTMPVQPMYGNGGFGNGFGGWGDSSWLILLVLFGLFGGGMWGGMGGFSGGMGLYPWMNQLDFTQGGFNQAATNSALAGINTSINNGFSNAEVAACNRAMNQMQTDYTNQIASMNQSFANAQALDARLDTMTLNQQKCCCDNAANTADVKYTVATEAAANRAAGTANTQAILDKLCQLELDGVRSDLAAAERENTALQNQLNMATMAASQTAQTAALVRDNTTQTQTLIQRIAPYPTPAYIVSPPYGYNGYNNGCGCNGYGVA